MLRKNFPRRVEQRRRDAEIRQADRERRTDEEQIALIDKRRGNSTRERERISSGKA